MISMAWFHKREAEMSTRQRKLFETGLLIETVCHSGNTVFASPVKGHREIQSREPFGAVSRQGISTVAPSDPSLIETSTRYRGK